MLNLTTEEYFGEIDYIPAPKSLGSQSSKSKLSRERRTLDTLPRTDRLKSREMIGSLEVLEDYGLMTGGTSVPSYYTSLKQKNRRVLEMKARSSRLRDRGKQNSLILESLYHMIKVFVRRGLNIEEMCRERDSEGRGMVDVKLFWRLLSSLGLPFRPRDIDEVITRYTVPSSTKFDYESLLRDANVLSNSYGSSDDANIGGGGRGVIVVDLDHNNNIEDSFVTFLNSYSTVMTELKQNLLETVERFGIPIEDVYKRFARWDVDGTGTITATQFFRVLSQLHIDCIEDQKQDFIVELLDIHSEGRINFEVFLSFCFAEQVPSSNSPYGMSMRSLYGVHKTAGVTTSSTLSDSVSASSLSSTSLAPLPNLLGHDPYSTRKFSSLSMPGQQRARSRPHTATSTRDGEFGATSAYSTRNTFASPQDWGRGRQGEVIYRQSSEGHGQANTGGASDIHNRTSQQGRGLQRPVTAFARMPLTSSDHNAAHSRRVKGGTDGSFLGSVGGRELVGEGADDEDGFIEDDDVASGILGALSQSLYSGDDADDGLGGDRDQVGRIASEDISKSPEEERPAPSQGVEDEEAAEYDEDFYDNSRDRSSDWHTQERERGPMTESFVVDVLARIRDLVRERQAQGKSLHDIFVHFERKGSGHFDAVDLRQAASDLRIELTLEEAAEAVSLLGIDGGDRVSLGEFVVFVADPNHHELQLKVQYKAAEQLEKYGRTYTEKLEAAFGLRSQNASNSHQGQAAAGARSKTQRKSDFVNPQSFAAGLKALDLGLSSSDVKRLIARFDYHGIGHVSISRFLRMVIDNNPVWERTLHSLAYYEMAREEQQEAHRLIASSKVMRSDRNLDSRGGRVATLAGREGLDENIVDMAAYLGICVFSESHLLWIVEEALRAPLPSGWTAQVDKSGRTVFQNSNLKQVRYDHPLDPYFRRLRDQERFRNPSDLPELSPSGRNRSLESYGVPSPSTSEARTRGASLSPLKHRRAQTSPGRLGATGGGVSADSPAFSGIRTLQAFEGSAVLNRPRPQSAHPLTPSQAPPTYPVRWFEEKGSHIPLNSKKQSIPPRYPVKEEEKRVVFSSLSNSTATRPNSAPSGRQPHLTRYNNKDDQRAAGYSSSSLGVSKDLRHYKRESAASPTKPDEEEMLKKLNPYTNQKTVHKFVSSSKRPSVVDRALGKVEATPYYARKESRRPLTAIFRTDREKRENRLATMYTEDILTQLDQIVSGRRVTGPDSTRAVSDNRNPTVEQKVDKGEPSTAQSSRPVSRTGTLVLL